MGSKTGSPAKVAGAKSPTKMAPKRKSPKKSSKTTASHPTYKEMIMGAVMALKQRGGSSRQAIGKYISMNYKVGENYNVHLKMAIKRALASGMLVPAANHSGTFRLNKAAIAPPKPKKKVTAKKPAAKKATKPKKKVAPKKKVTTPKKVKKTAAKKKPATKAKKPAKSTKVVTKKKTPAKKVKVSSAKKSKK